MRKAIPVKLYQPSVHSEKDSLDCDTITAGKTIVSASVSDYDSPILPPILNLPVEIFTIFLRHLSLSDLVAISLTTKLLRKFRPEPTIYGFKPDTEAEAKCISKIHLRFLPLRTMKPNVPDKKLSFLRLARSTTYKCPFCSHPLCPPTCSTALFLDSYTGIFFPRSLYSTSKAKFKYHPDNTRTTPPPVPSTWKLLSKDDRTHSHKPQKFVYSTIWCTHHRCPRNLLNTQPKRGIFSPQKSLSEGANLFLEEYKHNWSELSFLLHLKSADSSENWLTWARVPAGRELRGIPIRGGQEVYANTVYEYSFYETFCQHCLLSCGQMHMYSSVFGIICDCTGRASDLGAAGCRRCGLVSVRFTVVKSFGEERERSLCLATECKVVKGGGSGVTGRRLEPIDSGRHRMFLDIVRGRVLVDLQPAPKIGILDLPKEILSTIMMYVAREQPKEYSNQPYDLLQTSYIFAKYFYWTSYAPEKSFWEMQRHFHDLELVVIAKKKGRKVNDSMEENSEI
ncbi:hypothetical protein H072_1876 [Dactylellina haptotyla CBS 200.50]|uniref:F-box domain-containing protein n=1 Tax=Dactylellina haptotyla (strain CBS 200.50) TaxID=1284197 RepID=S8C930_DACHA|nr:hypothetical protein H072_1876 [Dactylellina haptotyla CBS 200.50]